MNRKQKQDKKRKHREERQRAARQAITRPRNTSAAPPGSPEMPPLDQMLDEMAPMLAPFADPIAAVLAPGGSDAALAGVAAAAEIFEGVIEDAWSKASKQRACKSGCSFCCRGVRVDASVPEVERLIRYARASLAPEVVDGIRTRLVANAAQTHGKTMMQYPFQLPCAFLGEDGSCLVYPARPIACRNEHSLDARKCEVAYDAQADGENLATDRNAQVVLRGSMVMMAFHQALRARGLDARSVELQEAALIALSQPGAFDDWLAGKPSFASAISDQTVEEGALVPLRRK